MDKDKGTVKSIKHKPNGVHTKKELILRIDHQQEACYEFRGYKMNYLENINVGEYVEVTYKKEGRYGAFNETYYNNLVAEKIVKIDEICHNEKT